MARRMWRAGISSKYALNFFLILFIVRSVASHIESDVSGRIGNATASLRLTRQKVLIQAVQGPRNSSESTRGKHEMDKQDDNVPPDIVVEEFRIRAKINFPAPRTCKDLIKDFSEDKNFRIEFSRSRDRRLLHCDAESLEHASKNEQRFESKLNSTQPPNDNSINSAKFELQKNFLLEILSNFYSNKFISNNTEKKVITSGDFDAKSTKTWSNSLWKNKEKRKIDMNGIVLQNGFLPSHGTSELKKDSTPREKKESASSEAEIKEIRQNKVNFKPKVLNTFSTFHEHTDESSSLKENLKFPKIASFGNGKKIKNTDDLPFFNGRKIIETKNNDHGFLPASDDSEKKLKKRFVSSTKIAEPCHKKPKIINVTDYFAALELKNKEEKIGDDPFLTSNKFSRKSDSEQIGFHRRERRSLRVSNNSTYFSNNSKRVPKKTGQSGKTKNLKQENSTKKSRNEVAKSKSPARKTRNLTGKNVQLEKPPNNSTWNMTMPPVFRKYYKFLTDFLKPFIDIRAAENKNLSMPVQKANKEKEIAHFSERRPMRNSLVMDNLMINGSKIMPTLENRKFPTLENVSNSTETRSLNGTKIGFPISTKINYPNSIENDFLTPTEIFFPTSTEINFANLDKNDFPNSTGIDFLNSTKTNYTKLSEINTSTSTSTTFTIFPVTKLAPKKARNNPDLHFDEFVAAKTKESNLRNSLKSMIESGNIFNISSLNWETTELPPKTERIITDTWITGAENNKEKQSEIEKSVTKNPLNAVENSTISYETTNVNLANYHEKSILNFTLLDPNSTDSILLNTLPNNFANLSTNIAEGTSTYPTIRRYSRNDTLEQTVSPKSKSIDAKNRRTKLSLKDLSSPNIVKKNHGGRGRKRSRYKGKIQQPFIANSLLRVGKQSWRNKNNSSVTATPSVLSTQSVVSISTPREFISTLPEGFIDSSDSGASRKSTSPAVPEKLLESFFSTVLVQTKPQNIANTPIVSDYVGQVSEKEGFNISVATEVLKNKILYPAFSTPIVYELSRNKELQTSTVSLATNSDSNFAHSLSNQEVTTSFSAPESKPHETVTINEILKNTFTEFSTLPFDNSISVDLSVSNKSENSIILNVPETKSDQNLGNSTIGDNPKMDVVESSSTLGNTTTREIVLPVKSKKEHEQVLKNAANGDLSIFPNDELKVSSMSNEIELSKWNQTAKKENNLPEEPNTTSYPATFIAENLKQNSEDSILEMISTESFADKQLNKSNDSTYFPETKEEHFVAKNTTQFNLRKEQNKKIKHETLKTELETGKSGTIKTLGIFKWNASSEKPKDIHLNFSSSNSDITDNSVIGNLDTKGETFSPKAEFFIASPTTVPSSVQRKTTDTKFLARKPRDTRTSLEYEGSEEVELDYDIDSLGGDEPVTEEEPTTGEDNAERNLPFDVNLDHSAVHGTFFKEKKATEKTSTDLHQHHYLKSLPVSAVDSSNSLNLPAKIPENLTNSIDAPELLSLVQGLEEFLFDDSVTGTSDRKQLLKNQDLDAELSNGNFEIRSAIFKSKKLSVNKKNEKKNGEKSDKTKNCGKKLQECKEKKTSSFSSSDKRNRSNTHSKMRKIMIDTNNEKTRREKRLLLRQKN